MSDEAKLQHSSRADLNDIFAEIDALEAPAEDSEAAPEPQPVEIVAPEAQAVAGALQTSLRFASAVDAWFKRKATYDANPSTFEATLGRRIEEANRIRWRAEYAERIRQEDSRNVRDYERDQSPERKAGKKAAKSKEERSRRLARSTPEQIAAEKEAAKARAKASRDRKNAPPEGFGKF